MSTIVSELKLLGLTVSGAYIGAMLTIKFPEEKPSLKNKKYFLDCVSTLIKASVFPAHHDGKAIFSHTYDEIIYITQMWIMPETEEELPGLPEGSVVKPLPKEKSLFSMIRAVRPKDRMDAIAEAEAGFAEARRKAKTNGVAAAMIRGLVRKIEGAADWQAADRAETAERINKHVKDVKVDESYLGLSVGEYDEVDLMNASQLEKRS